MMHRIITVSCVVALLAAAAFAAGKGPEIQIVDGKVSMQAELVPLGRLLRLLDSATGMTSRVPAELVNRTVSVSFSGLPFDAAVRKIFEGQPLDYIVISGKGIMVTAVAQTAASTASAPSAFGGQPGFPGQPAFVQEQETPPVFSPQPAQPAQGVVQSPFGPIPAQPPQPVPGIVPTVVTPQQPGAVISPFGTVNPFGSNPFGGPAPNNTAPAANPATPLFGNTAPVPFQQNAPPAK